MSFKSFYITALLVILCTGASVFGQNNVTVSKLPTNLQIDQNNFSSQVGPQILPTKPYYQLIPKPTQDSLAKILKNKTEKMIISGGVDTGGGTIVKSNQGIGLLDLYLYNKEAFADRRMNKNILESRSLQNLGVDLLTDIKQPIMQKTLLQINKWNSNSPLLTKYIKLALQNLRIYYHDGTFNNEPIEYHLPDQITIQTSDLKMIAIYVKGFGVHIGLDDFNKLPEKHQIALLIHESLRAMNIVGNFNYTNETLQKLTAAIMSNPNPGETLDNNLFLNGDVLISRLEYLDLVQKVLQLKNSICTEDDTIENISCDLQEKDVTIDDARKIAEKIFSHLYSLPKSQKSNHLLSEAYLSVIRFENSKFRELLSEANLIDLPQGYLTMVLDSHIGIENDGILLMQETESLKNALRNYFKGLGVDINYKN